MNPDLDDNLQIRQRVRRQLSGFEGRIGPVGRWVLLHVSPCDTQLSVRLSIQPGEIHPIEGHRLCVASLSLAGHCCRIVNHQINIVIGWMVG